MVALAQPAAAQDAEPAESDTTTNGAFLGFTLTTSVAPKLDLFVLGAYRTGSLDFAIGNIGLRYHPTPNLSFAASYFGLFQSATETLVDPFDDRLRVEAEIRRRFGNVTWQHRSRFEFRSRNASADWRYRPEVRATWEVQAFDRTIKPYVALEPFYDFAAGDWTILLGQIGATIPISDTLSIQPAFMRAEVFDGDDLNFYNLFLHYRF